jgi:hypothetical protein
METFSWWWGTGIGAGEGLHDPKKSRVVQVHRGGRSKMISSKRSVGLFETLVMNDRVWCPLKDVYFPTTIVVFKLRG